VITASGLDPAQTDKIQTLVQNYPASTQAFMTELLWEREMIVTRMNAKAVAEWAHSSYHDLVINLGRGPLVAPITTDDVLGVREERQCYLNCYEAVLEYPGYTYVEGLALAQWALVRHAWLEDENGRIIDPTWVNLDVPGSVATYFGVRFASDFLLRHVATTGWHSFFEADWMNGYQVLKRGLKINDAGFAYDLGDPR